MQRESGECRACKGGGTVWIAAQAGSREAVEVRCPACDGWGRILDVDIARVSLPQRPSSIVMSSVTAFPRAAKRKASGQYRMVNKGKDRGEVWLYGIIGMDWFGDGVTAKQFAADLKALGAVKTIDLRINSDGGVVTDARAMYNLLVEHPAKVISHIDGIAASAASFVAMAGEEIEIAEGGFVMIHEARGVTFGTAEDHERMGGVLRQVNQTIVDTYVARTNQDAKKVRDWMAAETWFDGKEAVEAGFADRIVENMKVAASLDHSAMFQNLPAALMPRRAAAAAALSRIAAAR